MESSESLEIGYEHRLVVSSQAISSCRSRGEQLFLALSFKAAPCHSPACCPGIINGASGSR